MKIFTVSELNSQIRELIINQFSYPLTIKGEVANPRISPRGHQYFTLRDGQGIDQNSINCVLFKSQSNEIISDYEGLEVLVSGNIDMYKGNGNCQIKIIEIAEYGEGALKKNIERTRKKLETEGLFLNKKDIPTYPRKIGIISSPESHALQDVCAKLKTRYPIADLLIYPSLVQGKDAPSNMIKQILLCNEQELVEVLLLVRGGGSLEDLMAFNDEALARSIYDSKIPIITGIGHKPDITIADYVSDVSMETPTAAAVHAAPDINEIIQKLFNYDENIEKIITHKIHQLHKELKEHKLILEAINPSKMLKEMSLRSKSTIENISNTVKNKIKYLNENDKVFGSRFNQIYIMIKENYKMNANKYKNTHHQLKNSIKRKYKDKLNQYKLLSSELINYSPNNALTKGYSIIRSLSGKIIKSKKELEKINIFSAEFNDGKIEVKKERK